ncbi:MAG: MFS transporter, partial [Deltaproteobacteria bacterium]|nr:MFS transporter [Deltaproteobacteria bacterium]
MNYSSVARKITAILFLTHSLGSAGFIAANTINTIVGAQLSGTPASAGVPSFIYQIGSALSAYVWGRAMDRIGRRGGIVLGLIVSVVGSGIAAIAVAAHSFLFFLVGMVLMGAGRAAIDLGRFAAAEIHPPAQRA